MASIENKVVSITFDNAGFEKNVAQTIKTLAALKESLDFKAAGSGLEEVSKAAGRFSLSGISDAVDNISSKFSVMGAVGFTVIQNLTNSAIGMAKNVAALVIDPMANGGRRRAENIEQAKFLFRGLEMDIDASMESARIAVTGTAYGLDVAAKAAAQLGGSGLRAGDEMTGALRGIAGIAAMTNSSYEEMSSIFITAAGKGKVMSNELERISHRGVNAAAALAKEWGITELEVREMASSGEISFQMFAEAMDGAFGEHATKANETYSGSLANMRAALSRIGATFFTPRLEQQRDLFNALTPVIDNFHGAIKPLINTITELSGRSTQNIIGFLEKLDFGNLETAMPNFVSALKNIYKFLGQITGSFKDAFRDVFPPSTTSLIIRMSEAVAKFAKRLVMSEGSVSKVTSVFKGLFSIIKIGMAIVKGVFSVFKTLFGLFSGGGSGTILTFFGKLGDGINALRIALVDGGGIANAFEKINSAITNFVGNINFGPAIKAVKGFLNKINLDPVIQAFRNFKEAVQGLFSKGSDGSGGDPKTEAGLLAKVFSALGTAVSAVGRVFVAIGGIFAAIGRSIAAAGGFVGDAFASLFSGIGTAGNVAATVGSKVVEVIGAIWEAITSALSSGSPIKMDDFLKVLGGGVLAVIAKAIYNFSKTGLKFNFGQFALLQDFSHAIHGFTGVMKAMQKDIIAGAILKIAIALGVLTLSLLALSFVDGLKLAASMAAVATGLGLLVGAMAGLDKIASGEATAGKIAILAVSMLAIGGAMLLLAVAARIMATADPVALTVGLLGMLGALETIGHVMKKLTKNTAGMVKAAFAIGVLSLSLLLLAAAIRVWMLLDMLDMAVTIFAISAALTVISETMGSMPSDGMVKAAFAIGVLAASLVIMAFAIKQMSQIGLVDTAVGIAVIAVSLKIMTDALKKVGDKDVHKAGVALLSISFGMLLMARAIEQMGSMDLWSLVKGVGAFAVMMVVMGKALDVSKQSLGGSASLIVAAAAIYVFAMAIERIAAIPFLDLLKAMGAVVIAVGLLAGVSALLTPIIPLMVGLGAALLSIGLAALAFGAGIFYAARGVQILAKVGPDGVEVFIDALVGLLAVLPRIAIALGQAAFLFVTSFLSGFDELIPLVVKLLGLLLVAIREIVPELLETAGVLILAFLDYITTMYPALIQAGWDLLLAFLGGIEDNIGELASTAIGIVTEFINAMAEGIPEYVRSMVNLFTTILTTMAYELGLLITTLAPSLGMALIDGILTGLDETGGKILEFFTKWVFKVIDWVKSLFGIKSPSTEFLSIGVDIIMGLLNGLTDTIGQVMSFFTALIGDVLGWLGNTLLALVNKGKDFITGLWNGIGEIIGTVSDFYKGLITAVLGWIGDTLTSLAQKGKDFIQGLYDGIIERVETVKNWFNDLSEKVKGWLGTAVLWLVETGKDVIRGLWNGIESMSGWIGEKAKNIAGWVLNPIGSLHGFFTNSPSKKTFQIGQWVGEGLGNGIDSTQGRLKASGLAMATTVLNAFDVDEKDLTDPIRDAISSMISNMDGLEDLDGPVITPVLDLTKVKQDAKQLNGILDTRNGLQTALAISAATNANRNAAIESSVAPTEIKYEQNIHAPVALSTNDIYRQTRSLIAITKEEAKIP